jgi:hypothetical protein
MNLGDRVLGPAPRPKPVGARLEVGLEDRLQHQLEGGLHDPVADRRDPQSAQPAAALGDQPLLDRLRPEAPARSSSRSSPRNRSTPSRRSMS